MNQPLTSMKTHPSFMRILIIVGLAAIALPVFSQPRTGGVPPAPVVPPGVTAHRDLIYVANGHERHRLDPYVPEKTERPLPLIIWIHGGGWQNGGKEGCPPLRSGYTQRGYAVASINYRLSGDASLPAQIEDCKPRSAGCARMPSDFNSTRSASAFGAAPPVDIAPRWSEAVAT